MDAMGVGMDGVVGTTIAVATGLASTPTTTDTGASATVGSRTVDGAGDAVTAAHTIAVGVEITHRINF